MSTLNSKFDILRGWPNGQAIEESYTVASGKTLYEGFICALQSDGTVSEPTTAPPAIYDNGGAAAVPVTGLYMVITGNDADTYDGKWLNKVVTLRGNFTVKVGAAQVVGTIGSGNLTVGKMVGWEHTAAGDIGKLKAQATNAQFVGVIESVDTTNLTMVVQMSL